MIFYIMSMNVIGLLYFTVTLHVVSLRHRCALVHPTLIVIFSNARQFHLSKGKFESFYSYQNLLNISFLCN